MTIKQNGKTVRLKMKGFPGELREKLSGKIIFSSQLQGNFSRTKVQQNFNSKLCQKDTQCKKLKQYVEKEML